MMLHSASIQAVFLGYFGSSGDEEKMTFALHVRSADEVSNLVNANKRRPIYEIGC